MSDVSKFLSGIVAIIFIFIGIGSAISGFNTPAGTSRDEARQTEDNQKRLIQKIPAPQLQDSIERRNLVERLQRNNKGDKIGYVYVLSDTGSVIGNYTIRGKVSSLNSLLTTPQQLVDGKQDQCYNYSNPCYSLDSPDFDGSYGKNPDGIFFFTTDGNMIEWSGKYFYSEQLMTLSSAPTLTYNVNK
jgi:hypothetical protein